MGLRTSSVILIGTFALVAAGQAYANHPNPGLSPSLSGYLVPVYQQCGVGTNPPDSTHSAPLGVQSCPATLQDGVTVNAFGPDTNKPVWPFSIRYTAPGVGAPCSNGALGPTLCFNVQMDSVVRYTSPTPPYVASFAYTGNLAVVARIRFTDHANCTPKPCSGPYTQPGTATDLDFGPVQFTCALGGGGKSSCNLSTDANSVIAGSVVAGVKTSIQVMRVRVNVQSNPAARQLLAQQGIAWP